MKIDYLDPDFQIEAEAFRQRRELVDKAAQAAIKRIRGDLDGNAEPPAAVPEAAYHHQICLRIQEVFDVWLEPRELARCKTSDDVARLVHWKKSAPKRERAALADWFVPEHALTGQAAAEWIRERLNSTWDPPTLEEAYDLHELGLDVHDTVPEEATGINLQRISNEQLFGGFADRTLRFTDAFQVHLLWLASVKDTRHRGYVDPILGSVSFLVPSAGECWTVALDSTTIAVIHAAGIRLLAQRLRTAHGRALLKRGQMTREKLIAALVSPTVSSLRPFALPADVSAEVADREDLAFMLERIASGNNIPRSSSGFVDLLALFGQINNNVLRLRQLGCRVPNERVFEVSRLLDQIAQGPDGQPPPTS